MTTLTEIKDQLLDNRQAADNTTAAVLQLRDTIVDSLNLQRTQDAADRLRQREQEIESRRLTSPAAGPFSSLTEGFRAGSESLNIASSAAFGATAQLAGRALGLLVAPFKLIAGLLPVITGLAKLVVSRGPFVMAITLLYQSLKDIGERPEFQAAVQGIKDLWSNTIIPTWNHILETFEQLKESFSLWQGTEEGQKTIAMFVGWWNNIDKAIEDFVINQLNTVTETLNGIFDGINLLLDGEWTAGISKIINSVLISVQDTADNMITAIANLFGVDFGPDGTFLGFVNRKWAELQTYVTETWNTLTTSISNAWTSLKTIVSNSWDSFISFFTVDIPAKFEQWKTFIADGWSTLTTIVSNAWDSIETWFTDKLDIGLTVLSESYNAISDKINQLVGVIESVISFVGDNFGLMKEIIAASFDYEITRVVNGFKKAFEEISTFIANIPDQLYLMISENLRFGMPTIEFPLPEWMQKWPINAPPRFTLLEGFEAGVGDATTQAAARTRISERTAARDASIQTLDRETASRLEDLRSMQIQLGRNFQQVVINQVTTPAPNAGGGGGAYILPASPVIDTLDAIAVGVR